MCKISDAFLKEKEQHERFCTNRPQYDEFIQAQLEHFGHYQKTYQSLKHGLDIYANKECDDSQLCALALRAGEIAIQAQTDVERAFVLAREGKIVLGEQYFYEACILLLWLEANRLPEDKKSCYKARQIVLALDHRIPDESKVSWPAFVDVEWWASEMTKILSVEDIANIVNRSQSNLPLAVHFATTDTLANGLQFIRRITPARRKCDALLKIAESLIEIKQQEKAIQLLQQTLEYVPSLDDEWDKQATLVTITRLAPCTRMDTLWQQVLEIASGCNCLQTQIRVQAAVAVAMNQEGQTHQAMQLMEQALENLPQIEMNKGENFLAIASVLAQLGQKEKSRKLFQSALKTGIEMEDGSYKFQSCCWKLRHIAEVITQTQDIEDKFGLLEEAVTMAWAIEDDHYKFWALEGIAIAMSQEGYLQRAIEIVSQIGTEEQKCWAIAGIVSGLVPYDDGRSVQQLLKIAQTMEDPGWKSKVLAKIAVALASLLQREKSISIFQEAMQTALKIGNKEERTSILAEIVSSQAQYGYFQQAMETVDQIEHEKLKCEGWEKIVGSMTRTRDVSESLQLVEGIGNLKHKSKMLVAIARALIDSGKYDLIREVVLSAVAHALQIEDSIEKAPILLEAATMLLQHLQDGERAQHLFCQSLDTIKRIKNNEEKYGILVKIPQILIRHTPEKIGQLFSLEVKTAQVINNDLRKQGVIKNIAVCRARIADQWNDAILFDDALKMARSIDNHQIRSEALKEIAQTLVRSGMIMEAVKIAWEIKDDWCKARVLDRISEMLVQRRSLNNDASLLSQIVQIAATIGRGYHRYPVLGTIAHAIAQANDLADKTELWWQAARAAHSIGDELDRSCALAQIAIEAAQDGYVFQGIEIANSCDDGGYKCEALAKIAVTFVRIGEHTRSRQAIDQALKINEQLNNGQGWFLEKIALVMIQAGEYGRALELAQTMEYSTKTLAGIATSLFGMGDKEKADSILQKALKSIEHKGHKANHDEFVDIAVALAKIGERKQADQVFQRALELIDLGKNDEDTSWNLVNVAIALAKVGEPEKSKRIWQKALDDLSGMDEENRRGATIQIATWFAHMENLLDDADLLDQILKALRRITDRYSKPDALSTIIGRIAKIKQEMQSHLFQVYLEVAQTLEDSPQKLEIFADIATKLAQIGQLTILPDFLEKTLLPRHCIIYTLQAWQQALVMYLENPVPAIKRSLVIFPFDYLLAYHGVHMMQLAHLKQQNHEQYHKIQTSIQKYTI